MVCRPRPTAHLRNLCFHRQAFALVSVPLEIPEGATFRDRLTRNGLSVRVVKDHVITQDGEIIRLDILYGVKAIYPDLACRLTG